MRGVTVLALAVLLAAATGFAQTRAAAGRQAQAAAKIEPATVKCPLVLGEGVRTGRMFCDVPIGRDPADGIVVTIPPHTGPATLVFDLHNRHTYSQELVKAGRAYRRYTATIGVLTPDNTLISRAVVMSEFWNERDLVDRIGGGAGPNGLKAVAPTGTETVSIEIPAGVDSVSILGEQLSVVRPDAEAAETFRAPGRPIAVISNVMVEYQPAPAPRRPAARRR
jgi:hypothetical protein